MTPTPPDPPHVVVDATPIPANRGGVGRYVDSIVPALVRAGVRVTVVAKRRDAQVFRDAGADVVAVSDRLGSAPLRFLWEQVALPGIARRAGGDVLHSVHYTFPLLGGPAHCVSVHDVTFFSDPDLHGRVKGPFFRWWLRRAARRGVHVVVPSRATAREFATRVGARPDRITVAYHGFDAAVFSPPREEVVAGLRERFGGPWLAFLGTLEPRKNVPSLVRGYRLAVRGRDSDVPAPALVLAGGAGWDTEVVPEVEAAVADGFDVRLVGYLPLDELSAFLGGAEAVVYPSLGEGFGLPVLEAMASGASVITTRRLSLPEVGGEAVTYVGTTDVEIAPAIAEAIDGDADRLRDLRRQAIERARGFTWDAAAAGHLVAYRAAVRAA